MVGVGAFPILLMYTLGIPCAAVKVLRDNRNHVRTVLQASEQRAKEAADTASNNLPPIPPSADAELFRQRFSFLFLGFRDEYYYFESVFLLEKAVLMMLSVFFWQHLRTQLSLGLLVIVTIGLVHARLKVFQSKTATRYPLFCCSLTCLVLIVAA